jgi:hypothetical protein
MMFISEMPVWVEQIKFFGVVGGGFWTAFTAYSWVKAAFTNTQTGVEGIKTELVQQTAAIVKATDTNTGELKELRSDIKMLVQAMIQPPIRTRAARRKK